MGQVRRNGFLHSRPNMSKRERLEHETDAEIRAHLAERVESLVASGMSRSDAEREALRRFGPYDSSRAELLQAARHREQVLSARDRIDSLVHDVGYAFRQLRRSPTLVLAVVGSFALGIGANSTMFGVVDQLLLRPPPHITAPEELVRPTRGTRTLSTEFTSTSFSYPDYVNIRDNARSFSSVAMQTYPNPLSLGLGEDARRVQHILVSGNYFSTLGVGAVLGRPLLPSDDIPPTGSKVVVIGYGLWQREFGGKDDVIGSTLLLASRPFTIVGVAPKGFSGTGRRPIDVWIPVSAAEGLRFAGENWMTEYRTVWLSMVARLKPDISSASTGEDVAAVIKAGREAATGVRDSTTFATPVESYLPRRNELTSTARVALLLGAVSILVLAIACANVANLLLARAMQRRREVAVRLALGISRSRLVRQLLVEGMALAFLGGAAALAVVHWGGALVQRALLGESVWTDSTFSVRVLAFTICVAVVVGLVTSLVPAIQSSAMNLSSSLKEGSKGSGVARSRTRSVLVVVQGALAVLLLSGTGLFALSLRRVHDVPLGMDLDKLVIGQIDLRSVGINDELAEEYFRTTLDRVRRLSGVVSATVAEAAPLSNWSSFVGISIPGRDSVRSFDDGPSIHGVDQSYFSTVGTRILRGRPLVEEDMRPGAEPVVVMNEEGARLLWPNEDALGKCVQMKDRGYESICFRIVGIAENTNRQNVVESGTQLRIYRALTLPQGYGPRSYSLIVRPAGSASEMMEPVRREMQSAMPGVPYANVQPMDAILDNELRPWRMGATMFTAFGIVALLLSALGLYGVVSYSVTQRMHEMGVRVALGAQRGDVARLVLRHGLALSVFGISVGLVLALASGTFVGPLLYSVSPRDPLVLGSAAIILVAVATIASLAPARRAARVNPLQVLRSD